MNRVLRFPLVVLIAVLMSLSLFAQESFSRIGRIQATADDVGGYGNIISGVDLDGDGNKEIYAVNDDWYDAINLDLIPRIYKYEKDALGDWQIVWSTRLPLDFQNTWPPLAVTDLDNDGKMEITWGPTNNFGGGLQPNPVRVVVFETPGDGSDDMGIDNGDGTWAPNASWTITDQNDNNIRPFRYVVKDIDGDGTDEIISSARVGNGLMIFSTDDVPDNGDGSETWTMEFEAFAGATCYDIAVLGTNVYAIEQGGTVYKASWNGTGYEAVDTLVNGIPGGSWKAAQIVDVDGDGTEEMLVAGWSSGTSAVFLVQESGDTLLASMIADPMDARVNRLYGGDAGDVDGDGNVDYIFGTRQSAPNGLVYRLEYQGGDITDPASYQLSEIDSMAFSGQQYDIFSVGDLTGDATDEITYSGTPRGAAQDSAKYITILGDPVTGIGDRPQILEGFALLQNYPNPFNPTTTLEFEIPAAMGVTIKIFNTLGQEVRTLVNETRHAGMNRVEWDGRNNSGQKVASGLYIYSMRAGKYRQSRRMTLLK